MKTLSRRWAMIVIALAFVASVLVATGAFAGGMAAPRTAPRAITLSAALAQQGGTGGVGEIQPAPGAFGTDIDFATALKFSMKS